MARIRSIKPEFWVSEQIAECSTNARLLFIGIWTFCDDNGVHPAKPKTLKAEVFPMDDISAADVQGWVDELVHAGLLIVFEAQGTSYWHVTGWAKHQKIDRPSCKHPAPPPAKNSTSPRRELDEPSTNARRAPPPGVDGSRMVGSRKEKAIQDPPSPDGDGPPLKKSATSRAVECPDGVAAQVWADWLALRKAKRAPVTETTVEGATAEATKAGLSLDTFLRIWCARGSQGLQADWLKPHERGSSAPASSRPLTPAEQRMHEACPTLVSKSVRQRAEATQPHRSEVIDAEPPATTRRLD